MARISHFYSMSYNEVRDMPLRTFWSFNAQVRRLRAEERLGLIEMYLLGGMGTDKAMLDQLRDRLLADLDEPTKAEAKFDPHAVTPEQHNEGIARLRALSGQLNRTPPAHDDPQPQS